MNSDSFIIYLKRGYNLTGIKGSAMGGKAWVGQCMRERIDRMAARRARAGGRQRPVRLPHFNLHAAQLSDVLAYDDARKALRVLKKELAGNFTQCDIRWSTFKMKRSGSELMTAFIKPCFGFPPLRPITGKDCKQYNLRQDDATRAESFCQAP
jgi:hypothetical protein